MSACRPPESAILTFALKVTMGGESERETPPRGTLILRLMSAVDGLIPPELLIDGEARVRARVLVVSSAGIGGMTMIAQIVRGLTLPLDFGFWFGLVIVVFVFALPLVQWETRSARIAGGMLSILMAIAMPLIHSRAGHFPAPVLAWFSSFPVLVTFFLGLRWGLVSAVTTCASVLYLATSVPQVTTERFAAFFPTFAATFSIAPVLAYFLAAVYERNRVRNETHLRLLNHELSGARRLAEQADQRKTEFLRHVSHELRTPLNALIGYSELLLEELEELEEGEVLADDARRITNAGQHLLALINGLLDVSKIEAGTVDLEIDLIELDSLLVGLREGIEPLVAVNNNALTMVAEPGLRIHSDRHRLHQVLLNLAGNACKFTSNGTITVTAASLPEGEGVRLSVADDGVGMSEEKLARVFDPFVQVDDSASRRRQGTGLGLSITKKLVEQLGGSISVHSAPGEGSTFAVDLPLRTPEASAEVSASASAE